MTASEQYLQRYAEPEAVLLEGVDIPRQWRWVLVVPAYRESPTFLEHLELFNDVLLILVLNRPDTECDGPCNDALRAAALSLGTALRWSDANAALVDSGHSNHVLLLERPDPLATREGVGLARKLGCDVALALQTRGAIESEWIHCSDADARLPEDYFSVASQHPDAVALTYPFKHEAPADLREQGAISYYEEFLGHYVHGLASAGSPYAFFTLGSCLAAKADAYAKVRGFPKRAAGEDFYLLNKLAKLGTVATPGSGKIHLSARISHRVPFGTGPALRKLLGDEAGAKALFYHPKTFEDLRVLLRLVEVRGRPGLGEREFADSLADYPELRQVIMAQGLPGFLSHAAKHCADVAAFRKQFHQWFDGFRTLKLIHALAETSGRLTLDEYREVSGSSYSVA